MRGTAALWLCLLLTGGVAGVAQARLNRLFRWVYPPVTEMVVTEHYLTDLGAFFLGSHRVAADLAYIQLLQYYGSPESRGAEARGDEDNHDPHDGHDHTHHDHADPFAFGGGDYPRLGELGRRLLRLDPFFHAAILEIGGALAYNLRKPDEALDYLREAIERDPGFHRYRLYVAAILFKEAGEEKKMIGVLEEAIKYPDCPALLENILGNLLKKFGRDADAARVYYHTLTTAADPSDRDTAERNLTALIRRSPEAAAAVGPLLDR